MTQAVQADGILVEDREQRHVILARDDRLAEPRDGVADDGERIAHLVRDDRGELAHHRELFLLDELLLAWCGGVLVAERRSSRVRARSSSPRRPSSCIAAAVAGARRGRGSRRRRRASPRVDEVAGREDPRGDADVAEARGQQHGGPGRRRRAGLAPSRQVRARGAYEHRARRGDRADVRRGPEDAGARRDAVDAVAVADDDAERGAATAAVGSWSIPRRSSTAKTIASA